MHCTALLALLDDAAFRDFDLLGLSEETVQDYKQLVEALTTRFSPSIPASTAMDFEPAGARG